MSKKNDSTLSFKDKDFFVGIDQGKKNWKLAVHSGGIALKTLSVDPQPEAVYKYMSKTYPEGNYYTVYEAGYWGFWPHRELEELGCKNMVVNPADVPEKKKERNYRSDRSDAMKLSRGLANGDLDPLYIPDKEAENFRVLARYLSYCTRQIIRIKTRIKSVLAYLGVLLDEEYPEEAARYWSGHYISWLEELVMDNGPARDCIRFQLEEMREHKSRKARILRRLRKIWKESPQAELIRLLCSVCGVAFRTAVVLYSELIDMKRFGSFDELKSYVGLIPCGEQSSEVEKIKGITKRRNRYMRHILIESSWVAIRQDPALFSYYEELSKRMKKQEAIVRVAKKLLSKIRYVWLHQEPYQKGIK